VVILVLYEGSWKFQDYWRGSVFAPFAVLVGLLCISAAFVNRKAT